LWFTVIRLLVVSRLYLVVNWLVASWLVVSLLVARLPGGEVAEYQYKRFAVTGKST